MTSTTTAQPRYVKLSFPCGLIAITTHGAETDGQVFHTFSKLTDVEKGPSRILMPAIVPAVGEARHSHTRVPFNPSNPNGVLIGRPTR